MSLPPDLSVFALPDDAVEERFVTASGPGGQNVNKVATAVQLRIDCTRIGLSPYAYRRMRELAGSRMTAAGVLVILAQRFRTQDANRADARERAAALFAQAHERAPRRIPTRPGKAAKARRVDAKKARSSVKQGRGRVDHD